MSRNDWHDGTPPPEAYSRITNPERFRPLHTLALALVEQLAVDYEVARSDTFVLLPDVRPFEHAHTPVTLTPVTPNGAPIAIAFTEFPSVIVRYGKWLSDPFPSCGCDACDETAEGEGERLERLLREVVAGFLVERLSIPWFGDARLHWELGAHGGGFCSLPREQARVLLGGGPKRVQWQPWPRRVHA